jgi:DNA invertase Pin-like site-specific DNA recombinase
VPPIEIVRPWGEPRSVKDLQHIVHALRAKGVTLKATKQPIDTATAAGKCFLDMLGVFAEFETAIRKERQLEGIAKAKAKGIYRGRAPTTRRMSGRCVMPASRRRPLSAS